MCGADGVADLSVVADLQQQIGGGKGEGEEAVALVAQLLDLGRHDVDFAGFLRWHFRRPSWQASAGDLPKQRRPSGKPAIRSEEHTSDAVTNAHLVCRLLIRQKNYSFYEQF